ncbi:Uncharacterised protein [Vibrio cholerae]|uniref:Uncharacterized protein n=1 Tax=Vibrio cholerae TaxID=666 RepID=A0A655WGS0_VIBCL|nr:Uncharacterised protein [Vibrio cholerae]CSB70417.1 Uncharacterised protein [Vibrio cholerae]CSB74396.1 Uncharacterised protein [Vibrio cholerae]CSB86130.1 Uncharacterised protein [Vibrio cholerae]CSB90577.1 Uncharacterised protein [Vibrio cholerae]
MPWVKRGVFHLGERFNPVDDFAVFAPKAFRIFDGLLIHRQIGVVIGMRMRFDVLFDRINMGFTHYGFSL